MTDSIDIIESGGMNNYFVEKTPCNFFHYVTFADFNPMIKVNIATTPIAP